MQSIREHKRIETISGTYLSKKLAGANESYHRYLRDLVIPVDGGRSALELGCGKGLWTDVLSVRYDQLDIVDGSAELLEKVLERCNSRSNVTGHADLVESFLQVCTGAWHHIYMTFLLEHLEDPVAVLRQLPKHMKPDGLLFVAVPNATSVHRVLAVRAGIISTPEELSHNDHLVGHRRVYTKRLLIQHIQQSGFQPIKEYSIGFKPFNLAHLESLSPAVLDALCASSDLVPDHSAYLVVVAKPTVFS